MDKIYSEYRSLPDRELVIVGTAVLDTALAELLTLRLYDYPDEYESFLGLNDDGRAPCGSFGARIQLAVLTGVIRHKDAEILRIIKQIRNKMAHRVKIEFTSKEIVALWVKLRNALSEDMSNALAGQDLPSANKKLEDALSRELLTKEPQAGAALFLIALSIYQALFDQLHERLGRITLSPKPLRNKANTNTESNQKN